MNTSICENPDKCSLFNPNLNTNWVCGQCLQGVIQERKELYNPPFTPQEEKEIEEFLDKNRKLFEDQAADIIASYSDNIALYLKVRKKKIVL